MVNYRGDPPPGLSLRRNIPYLAKLPELAITAVYSFTVFDILGVDLRSVMNPYVFWTPFISFTTFARGGITPAICDDYCQLFTEYGTSGIRTSETPLFAKSEFLSRRQGLSFQRVPLLRRELLVILAL